MIFCFTRLATCVILNLKWFQTVSEGFWRHFSHCTFIIEKGPENLIITRKRSVYKASRAFKNISSISWENFAYIPICFATSWTWIYLAQPSKVAYLLAIFLFFSSSFASFHFYFTKLFFHTSFLLIFNYWYSSCLYFRKGFSDFRKIYFTKA